MTDTHLNEGSPRGTAASPHSSGSPAVSLRGISKRFPGVQALSDVDLELMPGEVVGLAGENGSGKSTLMKILSGTHRPDEGEMTVFGESFEPSAPVDALNEGIAIVSQEVQVHPELTVAENLLFEQMRRSRFGLIRWKRSEAEAAEILERLNLSISPRTRLGSLPLHLQHMVSIAKMVHREPRVLILDEPTASLPEEHVERLFNTVRAIRDSGRAVVYITHRLDEYFEICNRVVVLRDGQRVGERDTATSDVDELVTLMVGRNLSSIFVRPDDRQACATKSETPAIAVRGLSDSVKLEDVDLHVAPGEILGVAGQAGSGRSTLARALFGAIPTSGEIEVNGEATKLRSPSDAIAAGIGFVPDDRKGAGLVISSSVKENLTMPSWKDSARYGMRNARTETALVSEAIDRFKIKTSSASVGVETLSGGNQQKIVIAKWIARRGLRVLILDEPTRGVDVGAKAEIYRILEGLAASGASVIVMSSELLELLRLSDRIVVMSRGRVVGEIDGEVATEESVTSMAFSGMTQGERSEG